MIGTVERLENITGRKMLRETWINSDTVVLTYLEDGNFETRVDGGPLSGWKTPANDAMVAMSNHWSMVRMVRSCE